LVGAAVKVILPPEQIEVVGEVIVTTGMTLEVVMVMVLLVAVNGLAHGSLLVITAVTTSPLFRVLVVNVEAVWPGTVAPFTCHR